MYSKGISWIDDCRIPFEGDIDLERKQNQNSIDSKIYGGGKGFHKEPITIQMYKSQGRFPANILVSDDMLNDGVIQVSKKGNIRDSINKGFFGGGIKNPNNEYNDKGSSSRYYDIDKWFNNLIE